MNIRVVVHPNAKHPRTQGTTGVLHVYVREAPVAGKANKAAIVALARHFGTSKSCVTIVRGQTSKTKIVRIVE